MTNIISHQLTAEVKLLQKIVLWHQESFLILKRSKGERYRSEKWDLPGGNSEWPQSIEDLQDPHMIDLSREVQEETGLHLDQFDVSKYSVCYVGSYFEAGKSLYTIIVGWQFELPESIDPSSVKLSSEHTEFRWITKSEFDQFDFGFAGEKDGFIRQIVDKARNEGQK